MTATNLPGGPTGPDAVTILYVDDEPQACKWFMRMFSDEFHIITAGGVDEALVLLRQHASDIAVLLTDYRMPQRSGMELLFAAQRDFRHLVRLLVTAYAEKEVAIAAINEGQVFRILEKPLDEQRTREALREALGVHRLRSLERAVHEQRVAAMRETLGFLAHELNTPLATVRGFMDALKQRYQGPVTYQAAPPEPGMVRFAEGTPGEVLSAIESAERRALYCQSLVATFVQSARDAYPGAPAQTITASSLVEALLDEYPFEDDELSWISANLASDFVLPGRRDLLYLVLCTLTKNALQALRGLPHPALRIELGREDAGPRSRPWIRFSDNGPGIAPEILARLTLEPVTTKGGLAGARPNTQGASHGSNGMGLIFCRRVVQSIGGSIEIESPAGQGASVTLYFQSSNVATPDGNRV